MVIQHHPILDLLMESYNSQDVSELFSYFAHDAAIYRHPSKLWLKGSDEIYEFIKNTCTRFPINQAEVLYRMLAGKCVIDMIRWVPHPEESPLDFVIIYQLKNELIVRIDVVG